MITLETPWMATTVATFFFFFFFLLLFRRFRCRKLKLPPGPKPWPVIGNLHLIGSLPHRSIHHLSQKYGPIMHLRFGSFPVVVGSSVQMAKLFLKTHDLNFASRPKTAVGKYITYDYSNITWSPYGAYWRQARKLFLMELFNVKRLESFEFIRREEMIGFLKEMYKSTGRTITFKDYVMQLSLNVISRMTVGKKYIDESENSIFAPHEFKEMLDELFLLSGLLNIGDLIPWLNFLDLQGYVKRMKRVNEKYDRFLEHVLSEHEERRGVKDYVAKDMTDVLLQFADDPNLEVKLGRQGVKALIMDLLSGGTDTSTITVEWAMSELIKKPEIFDKANEELDMVIGRERWVEEEDIANLPYINAIVKETMRLHPVVPMLVPRLTREDCQIEGYDLPKGTGVFINTWAIGRDPAIWENPNEFDPDRFMGKKKNIDIKGQDFELLPFGSGRRMCPGYSLGLKVIQSSLANVLHGFSWKLPEKMKKEDVNMEEIFGLTTPKKISLTVVPEARLPSHLYSKLVL